MIFDNTDRSLETTARYSTTVTTVAPTTGGLGQQGGEGDGTTGVPVTTGVPTTTQVHIYMMVFYSLNEHDHR